MTTIKADAIELPNGVIVTSTPDGCVAIYERGVNTTEWTPVKNPTGTHAPAIGHRFARLDQDNAFVCNQFIIESHDDTVGAAGVLAETYEGAPMAADWPAHAVGGDNEPWPINYLDLDLACTSGARPFNGSTTARVHLQTKPGETVSQFMARFSKHLDDQMRAQYGIGSQFPALPTAPVNFAVTFEGSRAPLPIHINVVNNRTRIQVVRLVQQETPTLDASPVVTIKRRIPGRQPIPGDNCGQMTFGYADVGYAGLNVNYGWPVPSFQAMIRDGNRYVAAYDFKPIPGQDGWQG